MFEWPIKRDEFQHRDLASEFRGYDDVLFSSYISYICSKTATRANSMQMRTPPGIASARNLDTLLSMNVTTRKVEHQVPLDLGSYTSSEAARLLKTSRRKITRWMRGYGYRRGSLTRRIEPLWMPQLHMVDEHLELGFRDLVELRFVKAFLDAGLDLLTVRNCLAYARECVADTHPFSTQRFQTDGRTIFLESLNAEGELAVLDLKKHQYEFRQVIKRTFKDLDLEGGSVVRWRPFKGKPSIILDPKRSFGQPITAEYGVPTVVLSEAVAAEGSIERAAHLYEVPGPVVRDAVEFEAGLAEV